MQTGQTKRWSTEDAAQWRAQHGWLCGFNYLPRSAVNWNEMWQDNTFDITTIEQELDWAQKVGFNLLRTNLPYVVWEHERDALVANIDAFLTACDTHNIKVILTLMDDCEFSGNTATYGDQPAPVPGVHNSQALASPGREHIMNPDLWPGFEQYVKDILSEFADDSRIILWDLYNEPTNRMLFKDGIHREFDEALETYSHRLTEKLFLWARDVNPSQPLTVAAWHADLKTPFDHPTDQLALSESDIITFHAYVPYDRMALIADQLNTLERPVICTEWMARHVGSTYSAQLPMLKEKDIGAVQWGLVKGKTQTWIPWPWIEVGEDQKALWFHDLLDEQGTPFDPAEIDIIRQCISCQTRKG